MEICRIKPLAAFLRTVALFLFYFIMFQVDESLNASSLRVKTDAEENRPDVK